MGLISNFLGGAGAGAAKAGQMYLAGNIAKERDEANDLREKNLRTDLQESRQDFLGRDRDKTIDASADRAEQKEYSDSQAAAKKVTTDATAAEKKEAAALERTKYTVDNKPAKNPQLIKYTDSKGYEQEGVLVELNNGKYRIENPETGEVMEKEITSEQLKNRQAIMDDGKPWYAGSTSKKEARADIVKERDAKAAAKPGSVNSAIEKPAAAAPPAQVPTAPAAATPKQTKDYSDMLGIEKPGAKAPAPIQKPAGMIDAAASTATTAEKPKPAAVAKPERESSLLKAMGKMGKNPKAVLDSALKKINTGQEVSYNEALYIINTPELMGELSDLEKRAVERAYKKGS